MENRLLDNVVRTNMRSRYMVHLYEEKVESGIYLTDEEKEDYIAQNAMLDISADIIYTFFKKIFPSIPFEKIPPIGMQILEWCQEWDKIGYARNEKQSLEEIFNNTYHQSRGYGERSFEFGRRNTNTELGTIRKLLASYETHKLNQYAPKCEQAYKILLGCGKDEAHEVLGTAIKEYLELPVETRVDDMNKLFACWRLHSSNKYNRVVVDKDYSTIKYSHLNMDFSTDYRKHLANVGIEMGEMPKTFVSEIYGQNNSRER